MEETTPKSSSEENNHINEPDIETSCKNINDTEHHNEEHTPQQSERYIDNSIFNTISKIVNPTTKVPDIQDFKIVKPISRGAFGKVFLGYKKSNSEQIYAIKVMKKNEMINKNMASQVVIERNALALTHSPYCVQLFYSLQSVSSVYLVMEYMVGGDLKSLIGVCGFLEESMAAFYTAEVCLALEYLHSHGIVHRDLKPDNMLLSREGHVKLTDFGLSKISSLHRDLEISDLVNPMTPSLCTRTPGQLLSLTSHLSFGSGQKSTSESNLSDRSTPAMNLLSTLQKNCTKFAEHMSPNSVISSVASGDYSRISGVTPFQSVEDLHLEQSIEEHNMEEDEGVIKKHEDGTDSSGSYYTCEASSSVPASNQDMEEEEEKDESTLEAEKSQQRSPVHISSPVSTCMNSFRDRIRGSKRKRPGTCAATGLTCEIDAMDLDVDKTPKRSNRDPIFSYTSPVIDDTSAYIKTADITDLANNDGSRTPNQDTEQNTGSAGRVAFSTPVSSARRRECDDEKQQKLQEEENVKTLIKTRFRLPQPSASHSVPNLHSDLNNISEDHREPQGISPIKTPATSGNCYTPYRTPKSVRRGGQVGTNRSDDRILGTPDYLAPELLLRQAHGPAVDWWALGVCLYEFCTGLPPFNDETPQAVFANILARDVPWPQDEEALSSAATDAIDALLTLDQTVRPSAKEVRAMALFCEFPWDEPSKAVPPFIPQPDDKYDTCYFQTRNTLQQLNISNCDT
ncbi:serine/threonine-protein kinase greatwall [Cataglyphis hispanica]|uniref:serine/threonine-protein kinase greatwall n=1 Tax=Cataglyphis hispanica TaxID=1086592 RepID=UPI00217FA714|nr:serine/threonine-protein kinase greatwall [Cataglyphis hispanica]